MKKSRIISLVICLFMVFSTCAATFAGMTPLSRTGVLFENGDTETTEKAPDPETAMENFVKKLEAGNFVIDAPNYVKTTAVSPDLVYFTDHNDSESALNYAFVTVEHETFEGVLEPDGLSDALFVAPGNAIDALGTTLPSGWYAASDENMWNLFYNNIENPLEFTSKEETVKMTLLGLAGYGQFALSQMEEVHMLFDAEDPATVHFTAVINDNVVMRIFYDDLDLTLEFGTGESDPRIDSWIENPVYPATRTGWTEQDIDTLDLVFFRGYGEEAVPFPPFTSYAMNFDPNAYDQESIIRITDPHGSVEDLEIYKELLKEKGYEEKVLVFSDDSSVTVYLLPLREDYRCYAQLYPYYDDGFILEGGLYYDNPVYENLEEISEAVEKQGFAVLEATDVFEGWKATDIASERSESWAYFFDYDMYLPLIVSFTEQEQAKAYFEDYGSKLVEKGFIAAYTPDEFGGRYTSANEFTTFRYTFNGDDTVTLIYSKEKSLSAEEVTKLLEEHNLPKTDIHGDIACRDHTRYHYIVGDFKGLFLMVYQPFESAEEAEKFLDAYVPTLDEQGYLSTDPQKLGSQRNFLYFNEELKKYVAFDFIPEENGANVNIEFVSIEPEETVILQSAIRH